MAVDIAAAHIVAVDIAVAGDNIAADFVLD
jgi:hypothetical protein